MKIAVLSVLFVAAALVAWLIARHEPSAEGALASLLPEERAALGELVGAAGKSLVHLQPVVPGVLKYHPAAVAVQDGHVVELRLSNTHLHTLEPLTRLVFLRRLSLDGAQLPSLRPLNGLQQLKALNLSRCSLTSLTELDNLPALFEIDLSGNLLGEVDSLVRLPALARLDLRANPLRRLPSPVPARWQLEADPLPERIHEIKKQPARHPGLPENWTAEFPPRDGKHRLGSGRGVVSNFQWSYVGEVDALDGGVKVDRIPGTGRMSGTDAFLTVEVGSGKVRAYLPRTIVAPEGYGGPTLGWAFCEAAPGKSCRIGGTLYSYGPGAAGAASSFSIFLESLDGPASGIRFRLEPRRGGD